MARLLICCVLLLWHTSVSAGSLPGSAVQYRDDVIRWTRFYLPVRPSLVAGQIHQESRWQSAVRSSAGATGLLQIMPATATEIARTCQLPGFDPLNPRQAIRGGICYDAQQRRLTTRRLPTWALTDHDKLVLMLRAFNGGASWLLREAERLASFGLRSGPATWLGGVCRAFRSSDHCRENVGYPHAVLKWAPLYVGWD